MTQRYFKAESSVSEQVRLSLDAAWGLPSSGQETCFAPSGMSPKDSDGNVLLAVDSVFCEYDAVKAALSQLLNSGDVEEMTADEYAAAVFEPDPQP